MTYEHQGVEFKRIKKFKVSGKIEDRFANSFRGVIRTEPLIDTGDLWKSIIVVAEIDYNLFSKFTGTFNYTLKLYAEDYLCYHIIPRKLFTRWRGTKGFQSAESELSKDFSEWLLEYQDWDIPINLYLSDIEVMNTPSGGDGFPYFLAGSK